MRKIAPSDTSNTDFANHFTHNYYPNVLDHMHKPDTPENNAILLSKFLDIENPSVKSDEEFSEDLFSFMKLGLLYLKCYFR